MKEKIKKLFKEIKFILAKLKKLNEYFLWRVFLGHLILFATASCLYMIHFAIEYFLKISIFFIFVLLLSIIKYLFFYPKRYKRKLPEELICFFIFLLDYVVIFAVSYYLISLKSIHFMCSYIKPTIDGNYIIFYREVKAFGELLYFSFMTISTTGVGDIFPATNTARFLMSMEVIIGIFFMVIFFALIINPGFRGRKELTFKRKKKSD